MLYPFPLDIVASSSKVQLPREVVTVKGVELVTTDGAVIPLTPLSFTQRQHPNTNAFAPPGETYSALAYLVVHRTLHLYPTPSTTTANGLRVWGYAAPPLPGDDGDEVGIPPETERYVLALAAYLIVPPPDEKILKALGFQIAKARASVESWLSNAERDVGHSMAAEGRTFDS